MKSIARMALIAGSAALALVSCRQEAGQGDFKYQIDEFADLRIIRYRIDGWEDLSLKQKEYVYHLSEAAKWGRDIYWDQNGRYNLRVRRALEGILENYDGDRKCEEFQDFLVYAKRVFFSNGIHHHYAEDKFFPACSEEYFLSLLRGVFPEPAARGGCRRRRL